MKKILIASMIFVLVIFVAYRINWSRNEVFVYPDSVQDIDGQEATVWRELRRREFEQGYRIDLAYDADYDLNFYTTTSHLDAIMIYYDNSLNGPQTQRIEYEEENTTEIKWVLPDGSMTLTYAPASKPGLYSLTVEVILSRHRFFHGLLSR